MKSITSKIFLFSIVILLNVSSQTLNLSELKETFRHAKLSNEEYFNSLSTIISRKNNAVAGLAEYLNASNLKDDESDDEPNRLYAVLALEGIGTNAAYTVLKQAALSHPNSEVKSAALRVFATSYHGNVVNETIRPSIDVILLLLQNCDDTTYVEFCHKRIGEIAREGIQTWMGMDLGDLPLTKNSIKVGKDKKEFTPQQYRELWWNRIKNKLEWKKDRAQYIVKK